MATLRENPGLKVKLFTLPENSISPENRPMEKEISIGSHHFWGRTVSFRVGSGSHVKSHDQLKGAVRE